MKILVVEDERQLCEDIAEDLELERYTVERCYDGLEAWEHILVESYDLVILDLNLPGMDGLGYPAGGPRWEARAAGCSSCPQGAAWPTGGRAGPGADDYPTKPFSLEELEARVRALCAGILPPGIRRSLWEPSCWTPKNGISPRRAFPSP